MGRLPFHWILFDAVGTLIDPEPSVAAVYHAAGRRHGGDVPLDTIRERFREVMGRRLSDRTGEATEYDFWKRTVADVIGPTADDDACFAEVYDHFARPEAWRLKPGAGETLADLAAQGYRLGVASNFDARLHRILDGTPALHPLTARFVSSEIGRRKPSPEFFRLTLRQLGVEPGKVLMIGDDLGNDICPALQAGMGAAHLACRPGEHVAIREAACRSRSIAALAELSPLLKDWHVA